jgi:hypothetical protein
MANDRRLRQAADAKEQQRITGCGEVVRHFANSYGQLARSVVSREELQEKIDSGILPDDLDDFIAEKIRSARGIELGRHGDGLPVILANEQREKHLYVIGKSGYGKTNFLRYLSLQDLVDGKGLAVLAPEMEMLTDELLPFIPDHRINDVIYFNPADVGCPVVLNPLHLEEGDDIDLHVDETFTILQRLVGEGGPRMDEILRHTLYALIERKGSTLLDIEPLLDRQDDTFRKEVIRSTEDEQTRRFFSHIYPQLPKDAHFPIVNRVSRIIRSKYVRNCLCPPTQTSLSPDGVANRLLNIRRVMDEGRILLCNLSDGVLGEAASQLIGQLIVAKFQIATMSRADTTKSNRPPYYLYLDEFQNFCGVASQSYEKILSRARKYRLGLILAHQQTGQIPSELLREIFGNVSTLVSFQVSHTDAQRLSKEFISQIDFGIETLEPEELLSLNVGEAVCRIGQTTFFMGVPKVDIEPHAGRGQAVVEASRKAFGIPRISKHTQDGAGTHSHPLDDVDPEEVF